MKTKTYRRNALTLVEVCLVTLMIALLIIFLLPMFYHHHTPPRRTMCVSNLKQIGLAFLLFANDHGAQFPWMLPITSTGTLEFANSPQVFRHFASVSNELMTPKVLACPADKNRERADDFRKLANKNLSYFACLDADASKPHQWLSGDRNISGGMLSNSFLRLLPTSATAGWTTELHNNVGNLGLSDGSVQQVMPASLQKQLQAQDLPVIRLAIP